MTTLYQLISIIGIALTFITIDADKGTVVVFGGNGFVGRRICEEAIARSYNVISISRSGCPDVWKSESWAKKVEWYKADALKIETFKDYIAKQRPIAIFTMMGTLAPYKQITLSPQQIFKYAGTTNINVCNVAAGIQSIKKFVYIGAPVTNLGIKPKNANNSYALWSQFWIGQYNAKLAVQECVNEKFGDNGIIFKPNVMAGNERFNIFGYLVEFGRFPFYDSSELLRKLYKLIIPDLLSVHEMATDALDFIEGRNVNTFKCPDHSKKVETADSPLIMMMKNNMDNIILGVISVMAIVVIYVLIKCVVHSD